MEQKAKVGTEENTSDSLTFEKVQGNENIVKAVSYEKGKKNEVLIYVLSEEQFESLMPEEELIEELETVSTE